MPYYEFSNPKKPKEVVSIFQGMNDSHEYIKNGVKWDRVWSAPQMAIDTIIDPFSQKDFLKKTQGGGTMGDLLDFSSELGQRRRNYDGIDPVKEQATKARKANDAKIRAERREKHAEGAKIKRDKKSQAG